MQQNIANWLSHRNFAETQQNILSQHQSSTCRWLLESQEFQDWRDGTEQLLWCFGIPGAGKTVASAVMIDHLRQTFENDVTIGIAFAYCQFDDATMQTTGDILAALLKQVAQGQQTLSDEVGNLYHKHTIKETRPTLDEITLALQSEVKRYSKLFIIVDALDEYSEHPRVNLLKELKTLSAKANVLITSRPLDNIARQLQQAAQLEIHAHANDVKAYVKDRIYESASLMRVLSKDPTLEGHIIERVAFSAGKISAWPQ